MIKISKKITPSQACENELKVNNKMKCKEYSNYQIDNILSLKNSAEQAIKK
jgi:hypothetical protein